MINHISQSRIDFIWRCFACLMITLVLLSLPELSMAQTGTQTKSVTSDNDPIGQGLCNIIQLITGKVGKAISTIAVIFLGVGLFLGKISWGLAIAVGIGIAGIFGAEKIVQWISGSGADLCASSTTTSN